MVKPPSTWREASQLGEARDSAPHYAGVQALTMTESSARDLGRLAALAANRGDDANCAHWMRYVLFHPCPEPNAETIQRAFDAAYFAARQL